MVNLYMKRIWLGWGLKKRSSKLKEKGVFNLEVLDLSNIISTLYYYPKFMAKRVEFKCLVLISSSYRMEYHRSTPATRIYSISGFNYRCCRVVAFGRLSQSWFILSGFFLHLNGKGLWIGLNAGSDQ